MLWKSLIFNLFIYFFFWNCFAILSLFLSKYIFFRLLSVIMKVYLIPHAIFEITRQGFIQILHHCSVSWKINRLYFSSSNLIYFGQKEPIELKSSTFGWLGENSSNTSCHIWNQKSVFFKLCITLQCHER